MSENMERPEALVLGIDLEGINQDLINSGVNINIDRVIEIGAALWDWNSAQPVKILSELVDEADRLPISDEVKRLTGISDKSLKNFGLKGEEIHEVLRKLATLIEKADFLMAHNAKGYDKPMLEAMFKRYNIPMPERVWIDTLVDVEFPRHMTQKSMAMLEYNHGFINPFPHRAITDVLSMLKIASNYSYRDMTRLAKSPKVTIVANLKAPNWKNRNEVDEFNRVKNKVAKSRFKWNPSDKTWVKEVHKVLLDEDRIHFDFDWFIRES